MQFVRALASVRDTGGRALRSIPLSVLARVPHSSTCVAATLRDILTAGLRQEGTAGK